MSVTKNVIYNMTLSVMNVVFPVVTAPYISRVLGVENIGLVNFAVQYVAYFVTFAVLGINIYGMREIAKHKHDPEKLSQTFSELFKIVTIATLIVSIVYCATIFLIPDLRKDWEVFMIAGIGLFLMPVVIDWYFRGMEYFKIITMRVFVIKCITFAGIFIFVRRREDVIPYMLLFAVSNIGAYVWSMRYAIANGLKIKWKNLNLKIHIKPMMIFFASNIAKSLYTEMNPILLGFMSDYEQVGYFTQSSRISWLIVSIIVAMSPVILTKVNIMGAEKADKNEIAALLGRSLSSGLILSIPAMVGLITIAPRFIPFFLGAEFTPAVMPFQLLATLIFLICLSNFFGVQILLGMGYEKKYLRSVLFGTIICISLNFLLIGRYGAIGTAIASVVAEIGVIIALMAQAMKYVSVRFSFKNILQPALAAVPIVLFGFVFNRLFDDVKLYLAFTVLAGGLFYSATMIFVFKNEMARQLFNSIINKIRNVAK